MTKNEVINYQNGLKTFYEQMQSSVPESVADHIAVKNVQVQCLIGIALFELVGNQADVPDSLPEHGLGKDALLRQANL